MTDRAFDWTATAKLSILRLSILVAVWLALMILDIYGQINGLVGSHPHDDTVGALITGLIAGFSSCVWVFSITKRNET